MTKKRVLPRNSGVYDSHGNIVLDPKKEAPFLVFPEKKGGGRCGGFPCEDGMALDGNPHLQHWLDCDGYLALPTPEPHGPNYPMFLTAFAPSPEDLLMEKESSGCECLEEPLPECYDFDTAHDTSTTETSPPELNGCHCKVCSFDVRLKERNSKPASHPGKFPRTAVPIACGACENY
jgi:hypothetical protein